MKKNKIFTNKVLLLIMILSIVGIFLSSILTLAKYNDNIAILCGEDTTNNCNTVQNSEYSNLFTIENEQTNTVTPIPITLAGIIYYFSLLLIGVFICKKEKNSNKDKKLNQKEIIKNSNKQINNLYLIFFIFSIFGLLFSIVYTFIQAFIIKAYCLYCLISAFDSLLLFSAISYLYFKNKELRK